MSLRQRKGARNLIHHRSAAVLDYYFQQLHFKERQLVKQKTLDKYEAVLCYVVHLHASLPN